MQQKENHGLGIFLVFVVLKHVKFKGESAKVDNIDDIIDVFEKMYILKLKLVHQAPRIRGMETV